MIASFLVGLVGTGVYVVFRVRRASRVRRAPVLRLNLPVDPGTRWARPSRHDSLRGRP
jgi:hypothetical protein